MDRIDKAHKKGTDFIDIILTRASVRSYKETPIPEEDIELILKAAMSAPTAVDTRPWSFIIIKDKSAKDTLSEKLPYCHMLKGAPLGIVVCGHPEKDERITPLHWIEDCSAATENILLAAHALGYGAVWTAVYPEEKRISTVREILGIPKHIIPLNVIPIGVPKEQSVPKDKYSEKNIHHEQW